ncbi:MAG TPA: hypothetical protein VHX65_09280 [Pirellulales bacterium]|nr:hypothetical protein [Pirellulales bacterium]
MAPLTSAPFTDASLSGAPQNSIAPRRVVLLGASNLTRGISTVVETATNVLGAPLEIIAALGHGRSYGMTSGVLGRTLPGILQCGLWDALAAQPRAPTAALITDIGNDIVYGASVESILGWIDECIARLSTIDAVAGNANSGAERTVPIVLTLPPTETVMALSEWRYSLMRSCTFPGCRLSRNDAFSRTEQLDAGLQELAARHGLRTVRPRGAWYGFDPIHIQRRHWSAAWSEMLSGWAREPRAPSFARGSFSRWLYLRSRSPARRAFFGIEQRAAQPCAHMRDGTTIAIY